MTRFQIDFLGHEGRRLLLTGRAFQRIRIDIKGRKV
jgi:hypothetical protein